VEHLAALRAIPYLKVFRPADANEVTETWRFAIINRHGPTLMALTRQSVPTLDRTVFASAAGLHKGAYVLADLGNKPPQAILMASGSEVSLIVEAGLALSSENISVRLVSFPCLELFEEQPFEYQLSVLPRSLNVRLAVEAGVQQGWERWTGTQGQVICLSGFGASAPYLELYDHFGITTNNIVVKVKDMLGVANPQNNEVK